MMFLKTVGLIIGVMLLYSMVMWAVHPEQYIDHPQAMEQQQQPVPQVSEEDLRKQDAIRIVSNHLKDQASAQFGDQYTIHGSWVCGFVNAKNSFGGYTGMMPFIVQTDSGWVQVFDASSVYLFKDYYLPHCQGRKQKSPAH